MCRDQLAKRAVSETSFDVAERKNDVEGSDDEEDPDDNDPRFNLTEEQISALNLNEDTLAGMLNKIKPSSALFAWTVQNSYPNKTCVCFYCSNGKDLVINAVLLILL